MTNDAIPLAIKAYIVHPLDPPVLINSLVFSISLERNYNFGIERNSVTIFEKSFIKKKMHL